MAKKFLGPLAVFALLVSAGLIARVAPHPPNFSPVAALALFAGFFFRNWTTACCVPVAVLLASDWMIGGYEPSLMIVVYASLTLPIALRVVLKSRLTPSRVGLCAIACSVTFFLCTNLTVWLIGSWYPRTPDGLAACFAAALPFFKYTVAGDLFCATSLFGAYAIAQRIRSQLHSARCNAITGTT